MDKNALHNSILSFFLSLTAFLKKLIDVNLKFKFENAFPC